MNTIVVIRQLNEHIEAIPAGTLGELLKGCKRLIEAQAEDLSEKLDLIEILKLSELTKIETINEIKIELDNAKVVRKRRSAKSKKGGKRGAAE